MRITQHIAICEVRPDQGVGRVPLPNTLAESVRFMHDTLSHTE